MQPGNLDTLPPAGHGTGCSFSDRTAVGAAAVAALLCLLVFIPALSGEFVNWDDPLYVINNPGIRILDRQFIVEAFTTSYMGWWMPLTWLTFAIDYRFWGLDPFGYHLTNILLHAVNTGLVVLIADILFRRVRRRDDRRLSGAVYAGWLLLAGLAWGIHPLRVESVAWVTERKDVLNGVFALGAVYCYLAYVHNRETAGPGKMSGVCYATSLLLLVLSFMAKPVSVVLPGLLLVMDWYPLNRLAAGRLPGVLLEKVPFAAAVAAVSFVTLHFASGNSILVSYQDLPLASRFILAGNSLYEYVAMTLYPVGIVNLYLLPWPLPAVFFFKAAVMGGVTCFCVMQYRRRPWLIASWLAFVLPLLPVLGFFQNGAQSHAARFTYLPGVVAGIVTAALVMRLHDRFAGVEPVRASVLTVVPAVLVLLCYGGITERHIAAWRTPETLWSRLVAIRPVGRAYYLRADYYLQTGRYDEAAADLQRSIELGRKAGYTKMYNLHALRGDALLKGGNAQEAVVELTRALELRPQANYYYHRGVALQKLGRNEEAASDLSRAGQAHSPIEWVE